MLDNAFIIAAAVAEIEQPALGVTKQFLKIHAIAFAEGNPKVAAITLHEDDQLAIVYFVVEGEKFYLAISISLATSPFDAEWAWTQEWNRISFHATSDTLDAKQLLELTKLKPTDSWNKGEKRRFGGALRKYSSVEFEPHPGPGEFEVQLKQLLTFLEHDSAGIRSLVDQAEGYLRVISVFHNGNTMLGGLHLDKECIQRMAALNLEIDFDLYAEGNFYKNDD
ncbi:hypothetical protein GCM10022409_44240 [Hymenobacter glaciei]|uniref:DUF4279 domain-containing protein n=1 Tax=Hymenobacter glaciei TaxID=877209 RepID=A0ABP7UTH1_9BACT